MIIQNFQGEILMRKEKAKRASSLRGTSAGGDEGNRERWGVEWGNGWREEDEQQRPQSRFSDPAVSSQAALMHVKIMHKCVCINATHTGGTVTFFFLLLSALHSAALRPERHPLAAAGSEPAPLDKLGYFKCEFLLSVIFWNSWIWVTA